MFYTVKHGSIFVPKFTSGPHKKMFYSFLINPSAAAPAYSNPGAYYSFPATEIFEGKNWTFKNAFKYQYRETAVAFVKTAAGVMHNICTTKSAEEFEKEFTILDYEKWPTEELTLNSRDFGIHTNQKSSAQRVEDNWQGRSQIYCTLCGALVSTNMHYIEITGSVKVKICPICVEEMHRITNKDLEECSDETLISAIRGDRVLSHL